MTATLNTTVIQNSASSTPNITLDTAGNVTGGANLVATGMPYGSSSFLRNRIINGNMQIWQRATSYALTNSYVYGCADRWETDMGSTAAATASQSTSVPTTAGQLFQYSLKIQRTASSTSTGNIVTAQALETSNSYDLAGSSVTLSFWAKCGANYSATSSGLQAYLFWGQGTDQSMTNMRNNAWTGQTNSNTTVTLTTSWQRFTFTATCPSTTTQVGMQWVFSPTGTAGADDSIYITGVQLEQGSVATPFERPLISKQLADCQRYYQMSYDYGTAPGTATNTGIIAFGVAINGATTGPGSILFRVSMRASPTISYWDGAGNASKITIGGTSGQGNNYTPSGAPALIGLNGFSHPGQGVSGNITNWLHYAASAEL